MSADEKSAQDLLKNSPPNAETTVPENTAAIGKKRSLIEAGDENAASDQQSHKKQALDEDKSESGDAKKEISKPKFVFGGSSSFSKGFKFTKTLVPGAEKNVKQEKEAEKTTVQAAPAAPKTAKPIKTFGSSTAFGKGFGLLKQLENKQAEKSNKEVESAKGESGNETCDKAESRNQNGEKPDTEKEKETDDKPDTEKEKETSDKPDTEKETSDKPDTEKETSDKPDTEKEASDGGNNAAPPALSKLEEVYNGEEGEETIFNANCKLYALADLKEGWKERGLGPIHLNFRNENNMHRLIMRQRLTLQILLNLSIVKGMKVFKGFPGSSNPEKFVRVLVTVDNHVVQYALKFGSDDLAEKVYTLLKELV